MAEQKGMGGLDALRLLSNPETSRPPSPEEMQQSMFASRLSGSRTWRQDLQKMEAFRLPNFRRK